MITMSGTIATLFMGFGSVLLRDITKDRIEFLIPASIILMAEIILTILTIRYAVDAYKLKGFFYFYKTEQYLFFDDKGNLNEEIIKKYVSADKDVYNKLRMEDCLSGIYHNAELNRKKMEKIMSSQDLFYFALLMIPVFAAIIIINKFI